MKSSTFSGYLPSIAAGDAHDFCTGRSAYTKRILEIVGSVKKQREGIMVTIGDTRQLRKDINTATDRIARSFQAAEELIFQVWPRRSEPGDRPNQRLSPPASVGFGAENRVLLFPRVW